MNVSNIEIPYNSFVYTYETGSLYAGGAVTMDITRIDESTPVLSFTATKEDFVDYTLFTFIVNVPLATYYVDGDNTDIGASVSKHAAHKYTISDGNDTFQYGKMHIVKVA